MSPQKKTDAASCRKRERPLILCTAGDIMLTTSPGTGRSSYTPSIRLSSLLRGGRGREEKSVHNTILNPPVRCISHHLADRSSCQQDRHSEHYQQHLPFRPVQCTAEEDPCQNSRLLSHLFPPFILSVGIALSLCPLCYRLPESAYALGLFQQRPRLSRAKQGILLGPSNRTRFMTRTPTL